jgi:flagellar basal-body rod modification protein FlgD
MATDITAPVTSSRVTDNGTTVTSTTYANGLTFTDAASGKGLESADFINLMLVQLKNQDPTNPTDSKEMLNSQMQLSQMEANKATVDAMKSFTETSQQNALASATSMIGNIVENGNTDDTGANKQYRVSSVENIDGQVYLTAYGISGYYDIYHFQPVESATTPLESNGADDTLTLTDGSGTEHKIETNGKTYEQLAEELNAISGVTAKMVEDNEGKYQLVMTVENAGSSLSSNGIDLAYSSSNQTTYDSEPSKIPYTSVTAVF